MNCPYCGGEINTNYSTIPTAKQDQPLSPWAYFGYTLLFQLPVIGFICLIIYSLDNGNINRRNYARMF